MNVQRNSFFFPEEQRNSFKDKWFVIVCCFCLSCLVWRVLHKWMDWQRGQLGVACMLCEAFSKQSCRVVLCRQRMFLMICSSGGGKPFVFNAACTNIQAKNVLGSEFQVFICDCDNGFLLNIARKPPRCGLQEYL